MADRAVVLYSARGCAECERARAFLRERGIEFADVEATEDARTLRELVNASGKAVVPTIVVGDDVLVGWDQARVEEMLAQPLPPPEDDIVIDLGEDPGPLKDREPEDAWAADGFPAGPKSEDEEG
jgi:glutaredoxin 3